MHVVIAGAGLSGLCLAQGLTNAGISCAVYERDPDLTRRAGYRITMNGDGGDALQRCLAPDLYELYLQCSRVTPPRRLSVVVDEQCEERTTAPHLGPPNEGERPHTAIDRRTLRQILAARLGDRVQPGAAVVDFTRRGEGVVVELADGSRVEGDVLVGADGVASAVRARLLPEVEIIDTGVRGLGVFARTPHTPEIHATLPSILLDGFVIASDSEGVTLALGAMDPREPPEQAAARLTQDLALDPVAPYMMLSGGIRPGTVIPAPGEWHPDTPAEVHGHMCDAV